MNRTAISPKEFARLAQHLEVAHHVVGANFEIAVGAHEHLGPLTLFRTRGGLAFVLAERHGRPFRASFLVAP